MAATTIAVGDRLPQHTFMIRKTDDSGPEAVESSELWGESSGTIVLFGLPGAFTPTCSARHLPGFVDDAEALRAKGVKAVYCVSVNDAFVMRAWGREHNANNGAVTLLPDADASFVQKLGLATTIPVLGGVRSQRFVLIAKDGVVSHIAIDEPGKFEVTSSEAVAAFL